MEKVKTLSDGSLALKIDEPPTRPVIAMVPPPPPASTAKGEVQFAAPGTTQFPGRPAPEASAELPTDPVALLDQLVSRFGHAHGAVLASVDGFPIARSASMDDEASHPAMLAAAVGLSHQLVAMGGGEQLRQLVVDHDRGLLLVWPIGDQRVLAVLADRAVDQRALRSFVQTGAAVLLGSRA